MKFQYLTFAVVVTLLVAISPTLRADVWAEIPDAGQTIGSGQSTGLVGGNSLTMVTGTLGSPGDVDLYRIQINTPSAFSATTNNLLTSTAGLDTQLYLFSLDGNGRAINANDDDGSLQSTLPAAGLPNLLNAGVYYLAIATSGNEAVDAVNQLLFSADSPSTTIRTPNNSAGSLAGWDTTFADPGVGAYEIDLTGAFTAVPEPSTWFAAALAVAGVLVFRRRSRNRSAALAS